MSTREDMLRKLQEIRQYKAFAEGLNDDSILQRQTNDKLVKTIQLEIKLILSKSLDQSFENFNVIKKIILSSEYQPQEKTEHSQISFQAVKLLQSKLADTVERESSLDVKARCIKFFIEFTADLYEAIQFPCNTSYIYALLSSYPNYLELQCTNGNARLVLRHWPLVEKYWKFVEINLLKNHMQDSIETYRLKYYQSMSVAVNVYLKLFQETKLFSNKIEDAIKYGEMAKVLGDNFLKYAATSNDMFIKVFITRVRTDLMVLLPSLALAYIEVGNIVSALVVRELCFKFRGIELEKNPFVCVREQNFEQLVNITFDFDLLGHLKHITIKMNFSDNQRPIEDFYHLVKKRSGLFHTFSFLKNYFLDLIRHWVFEPYSLSKDESHLKQAKTYYAWVLDLQNKSQNAVDPQIDSLALKIFGIKTMPHAFTAGENASNEAKKVNSSFPDEDKSHEKLVSLLQGKCEIIPLSRGKLYLFESDLHSLMQLYRIAQSKLGSERLLLEKAEKRLLIWHPPSFVLENIAYHYADVSKTAAQRAIKQVEVFTLPATPSPRLRRKTNINKKDRDKKFNTLLTEMNERLKNIEIAAKAKKLNREYKNAAAKSAEKLVAISGEKKEEALALQIAEEQRNVDVVTQLVENVKHDKVEIIINNVSTTEAILSKFSSESPRIDAVSQALINEAQFYLSAIIALYEKFKSKFKENISITSLYKYNLSWFALRILVILHLLEVHKLHNLNLHIALTLTQSKHRLVHGENNELGLEELINFLHLNFKKTSDYWQIPHAAKEKILLICETHFDNTYSTPDEIISMLSVAVSQLPDSCPLFVEDENGDELNKAVALLQNHKLDYFDLSSEEFLRIANLVALLHVLINIGEKTALLIKHFHQELLAVLPEGDDFPEQVKNKTIQFLRQTFTDRYINFLLFCKNEIRNRMCHEPGFVERNGKWIHDLIPGEIINLAFEVGLTLAVEWQNQLWQNNSQVPDAVTSQQEDKLSPRLG